ncbi:MAG: HAMP domain-containing sensor histidine kinase [Planctomycetota bacterium]
MLQSHSKPESHVAPERGRPSGLLRQIPSIRKKLLLLHTLFSLTLAAILALALRPALGHLVRTAEAAHASEALRVLMQSESVGVDERRNAAGGNIRILRGPATRLGLPPAFAAEGATREGEIRLAPGPFGEPTRVAVRLPGSSNEAEWLQASTQLTAARAAVVRLYGLLVVALLIVYALVVLALEVFVLPRNVYAPIRLMLEADRAVQAGERTGELVPEGSIPRDELGQIMRSRNQSVRSLREHETALARAFGEIEQVAADLRRKNHLLERAKANIAASDRLASLGMMSAGIAHELNTPLAVLKGLVERLNATREPSLSKPDAELMQRVVGRLERLGESLLDYARARPPETAPVGIADLVDEAITLVRLDRGVPEVAIHHSIDPASKIEGDADRLVQVFVNLIRNAVDAVSDGGGQIKIETSSVEREGRAWVEIQIADNGPGIEPEVLATLFEPFVSTRLDARGTGLGLAVAEGIVVEHGGVILAQNRMDTDGTRLGAVFEVVLPREQPPASDEPSASEPQIRKPAPNASQESHA